MTSIWPSHDIISTKYSIFSPSFVSSSNNGKCELDRYVYDEIERRSFNFHSQFILIFFVIFHETKNGHLKWRIFIWNVIEHKKIKITSPSLCLGLQDQAGSETKVYQSRQTNIMSRLAQADDILWQGWKTDWNHPLLLTANMHHKGHLVSVTHSDDDSWGSLLTFVRTRRLSISIAGHNKGEILNDIQ